MLSSLFDPGDDSRVMHSLDPLKVIQEISGYRTLDELYKYLEVSPEQVRGAIALI